jgi:hypothetical protein
LRRALAPALACTAALTAAACGQKDVRLEPVCNQDEATIIKALAAAPRPVTLTGGIRLSTCVDHARDDGDIQSLGFVYGDVARELAEKAATDDGAAASLGYLIAAVRKGASHSNGITAELARRMEQSTGIDGPSPERRPAFERGLAAGRRTG